MPEGKLKEDQQYVGNDKNGTIPSRDGRRVSECTTGLKEIESVGDSMLTPFIGNGP